jgi:polyhydroxybutyrate depolymerase
MVFVSLALGLLTCLSGPGCASARADDYPPGKRVERTLRHDGRDRTYLIHVPETYEDAEELPLVFVFHGGAGTARKIAQFTGFDALSSEHGFVVVYPQGLDRHWNDGRRSEVHDSDVDDVGFIVTLLESLERELAIDGSAVFATGLSNGAMFSHRLGIEQSRHFAAIAPVIGGIPEPLADRKPERPVSVLMMNGTDDPLVPYDGGPIVVNLFPGLRRRRPRDRGRIIGTDAAVRFWLDRDRIAAEPESETLPDVDPGDGCTAEKTEWNDAERGVSVVLYKINGGGHTYPGGQQYLPQRYIGKTCRDFGATEVIWRFFDTHRRRTGPGVASINK